MKVQITSSTSDNIYFRACHGMNEMSDEEIESFYGKERKWKYFNELKSTVHHGG